MSTEDLPVYADPAVQANQEPKKYLQLRAIISDAYAFVRSVEANQAFATVTIEALIDDQIKRNGESTDSNAAQFNPYSYDPNEQSPAGLEPNEPANFLGGTDTGLPSKLDWLTAIENELGNAIEQIKVDPIDVAEPEEYTEQAELTVSDNE
jgi:hypothetical protein